jgi:hypothetical protein
LASLTAPSGRVFDSLPIDNSAGFPQSFSVLLAGVNYSFHLYVNVPAAKIVKRNEIFDLPSQDTFLVVSVDRLHPDAGPETIFLRKVVPSVEYVAGPLLLYFPQQRVAAASLNGQGDAGSNVVGGVAQRWA